MANSTIRQLRRRGRRIFQRLRSRLLLWNIETNGYRFASAFAKCRRGDIQFFIMTGAQQAIQPCFNRRITFKLYGVRHQRLCTRPA